jgi:DNA-binding response OmpR family regulator
MNRTGVPTSAGKGRARVLVVEDDAPTSDALVRLLRHYGFDVLLAATVQEAMRHLSARPDHILLDLMLPDGDGTRVLEAVRQAGMHSHVIVITGVSDPEYLDRVSGFKPAALLKKPVDFRQILEKLAKVA